MDLNLLKARQPVFLHQKKKQLFKGFYTPQSYFGLNTLPANPKPGVALFAMSLIIFHDIDGTM